MFSGTEGKASKRAVSKRGDGREPADDIDVHDVGRVSSPVVGERKEAPGVLEASAVVEKNADGVMTGRGGTNSAGSGGRRDERANDVDRFGGWNTLTSVSDTGRIIDGVDGIGSRFEEVKGPIDMVGRLGASSGIRSEGAT